MAQASECEFLRTDKDVLNTQSFLKLHGDQSAYWPGHKINSFNYIFTKLSVNPRCAILIQPNQDDVVIATTSDIRYDNKVYDLYNQLNKDIQVDLKEAAEKLNLESVYLQDLSGMRFVYPQIPSDYPVNNDEFILNMFLHEGFHLFVQNTPGGIDKKWSEFIFFNRDELEACYVDERVSGIFEEEIESLISLYQASMDKDISRAKSAFKQYYALRTKRHAILADFKIPGLYGSPDVNCQKAEIRYEFTEGMPEYFANSVLLDLGILKPEKALQSIATGMQYYAVGSAKLFALKTFMGEKFIGELEAMLNSDDDQADVDALVRKTFELGSP